MPRSRGWGGGLSHESETKGGWEGDKDAAELDNRVEMMPRVNRRAFWSAWASGTKRVWNGEGAPGGLSDGGGEGGRAMSPRCFQKEIINQTFESP